MSAAKDATQMLVDWRHGQQAALDELMSLVYDELRALADHYLRRERPDHTLQATALVHEAYLRLIQQKDVDWKDRAHFIGIAAHLMREILVNYAIAHQTAKRGGGEYKLSLDEAVDMPEAPDVDLIAVDTALKHLARIDPQQSRMVELRFFGGLTIEEIADVLGIATIKVSREWRIAKAWLHQELVKDRAK